jgi:hypothetical protein
VLASAEIAFSAEVVMARSDVESLTLAGAKDDFISVVTSAAPRKVVELTPFSEWLPHRSSMQVQNPTCSTPRLA